MRANDVIKGIKEGWLKLKVDHIIPLKDAARAHEMLETARQPEKLSCSARIRLLRPIAP